MKSIYAGLCILLTGAGAILLAGCGGGDSHAKGHGDSGHDAKPADKHADKHSDKHADKPADMHADKHGKAATKHGGGHGGDSHDAHAADDLAEIDLGEFTVTQRQPGTKSILVIRFKIYGVVEMDKKEAFTSLLEVRRQRMRDNVITIVQRAEMEQLADPTLGWLKSELIGSINKVLKTRSLQDVVFSDFAMLQG